MTRDLHTPTPEAAAAWEHAHTPDADPPGEGITAADVDFRMAQPCSGDCGDYCWGCAVILERRWMR